MRGAGIPASYKLVRWLSAVLTPSMGWFVNGPLLAWVVCLDANIVLFLSRRIFCDPQELPPCPMTTLTIPLHRSSDFTPRLSFCLLSSRGPTTAEVDVDSTRQYFADLRNYMRVTLHRDLGSAIWSICWKPDISCNLVSAWYASISHVLGPFLKTSDAETIARVFVLCRPRIGLRWLGIFLFDDLNMFSFVERLLEMLDERCSYTSMSRPDPVVAARTEASQSFFDRVESRGYGEANDIPRSDILWRRHNCDLSRLTNHLTTASPPSGTAEIEKVEVEFWPFLQQGSSRDYLYWVWRVKSG
ncbi:hypothetical protein F4678DRAFT_417635 [Xylaria arbuscula]|nr:hypothetical protein F4678DRAFT_417635 [Xylaria arbuscula]